MLVRSGSRRGTVDLALVVPLSGRVGMFGPSCEASAELAVAAVNTMGGILDRQVRLHPVDAEADLPTLAHDLDRLIGAGAVDGVVGWHSSSARKVITSLTAHRAPYVYTAFYEGGASADGVFMVGETPRQQLFPAMGWLREFRGVRRWCVVGNEGVWPRLTAQALGEFVASTDMALVGQAFVPLGNRDFSAVLAEIRASPAQGVLVLMAGADSAAFNRAFARAQLDETRLRLAMRVSEDVLLASGADATRDLYTVGGYFESVVSEPGMRFAADYEQRFGADAPSLNNIGESCFEGILLFAALSAAARTLDVREIQAGSDGVEYQGPRGGIRLSGGHTTQPVYLAKGNQMEFDVVARLDTGD